MLGELFKRLIKRAVKEAYQKGWDDGLAKGYELGYMMGQVERTKRGFIIGSQVNPDSKALVHKQVDEIMRGKSG